MPMRSAIVSVGSALPDQTIAAADIAKRIYEATGFEMGNGLVERITGVRTRRYRADDEQSSDFASRAGQQALERAELPADQLDLVIFSACTQDITEPATANIVQEKIGAVNAQVMDVKNACNSFLNGLDVADSHIRAGKSKRALVVSGETLSLGIDWNVQNFDDLKTRIAGLTLGDAGAAALLQAVPEEQGRGILATRFRSYGDKWRLATVLGGGSMYQMDDRYACFRSESRNLRDAAYSFIPEAVEEVLGKIGWKASEVDLVCGHQVTEELVYGLSERCGLPAESNSVTIKDFGNTAAASIPLCLARAYDDGRIEQGTRILLVGGAAGFSVGVIPLIW